jgi:hypothetical protein
MPLTTTQLLMREAVQRAADVVAFTDKHPVAAVNHLLNRGLGALSRVCRTVDPEFQPIASTTIVADGINTVFSLPSNFRSLLSVEYTDENDCKTWLTPYELGERPLLASASTTAYAIRATSYRLIGANIELLPRPPEDHEGAALPTEAAVKSIVSQRDGKSRQLDTRTQSDEIVSADDAGDTTKLARLLTRLLAELAAVRRRWVPRSITFRDVVSTGDYLTPVEIPLKHNLGGLVEFWVVDTIVQASATVPLIVRHPSSDPNTLVISVYYSATFAIRVEEAG